MRNQKKSPQSVAVLGKYTTVFAYIILFILFSIFAPGFFSTYSRVATQRVTVMQHFSKPPPPNRVCKISKSSGSPGGTKTHTQQKLETLSGGIPQHRFSV